MYTHRMIGVGLATTTLVAARPQPAFANGGVIVPPGLQAEHGWILIVFYALLPATISVVSLFMLGRLAASGGHASAAGENGSTHDN